MTPVRLVITAALASILAVLLSCGSGSDTPTSAPTPTPNTVSLNYDVKQLRFSWAPVPGATHYRLFERAAAREAFVPVGSDLTATNATLEIPVHLRQDAEYRVESCAGSVCTLVEVVRPIEHLVPAIGYQQEGSGSSFARDHGDFFGSAVAISADGRTLLVAAPYAGGLPRVGTAQAYSRVIGQLSPEACCGAPNPFGGFLPPDMSGDFFGTSVAVSADGTTIAIGAPGRPANDQPPTSPVDPRNAGAVYVFVKSNGIWALQAYLRASNLEDFDRFGTSVALSSDGSTLAVGALFEGSAARGIDGDQADNTAPGAGAVYIFSRTGTVWTQQAYVKASNTERDDEFGGAVALSGDGNTLAVGAALEDAASAGINGNQADNSASGAGAVYVFVRNTANWTQQAYLKASNAEANDAFGRALSLSFDGNTLAVGASAEASSAGGINGSQADNTSPGAGAVYLFARSAGSWMQQAYVKASTPNVNDQFGSALALSTDGNVLAVGAPREQSRATGVGGDELDNSVLNAGAAYVFTHTNNQWAQRSYVKASNTASRDEFGASIALSGNGTVLVVGAPGKASGGGAAYLY